jgi:hypothetical protein
MALPCPGGHRGGGLARGGFGVAQVVVADGLEFGVQLVHQGMPLGMFRPTMSSSADVVQVLDQRPDRVAVRGDHDALALP